MKPPCTIEGCDRPGYRRTICLPHYTRLRKFGNAEAGPPLKVRSYGLTIEERFWMKVNKSPECWEWQGVRTPEGYGYFKFEGRMVSAHRRSWVMANGAIPAGMQIDHLCHNESCVRPEHLRVVTPKQNAENRRGGHGASGLRGVQFQSGRWRAVVTHNRQSFNAGLFSTAEEAAEAARNLRNQLYTHNDLDRKEVS